MRIAIYDLDKTLTRRATFTPFLAFAARRTSSWRVLLLPLWVLLMLGYKAGLMDRTALKRRGMKLLLPGVHLDRLQEIGRKFTERRLADDGLMPGALRLLAEDRAAGARIAIATAAFEFYARAFADALEIDQLIATRWDGASIPGGNCYGETKRERVVAWLTAQGVDLDKATIRFVSDSFADAPLLDLAQEAIFVTDNPEKSARAAARGWQVMDLSR